MRGRRTFQVSSVSARPRVWRPRSSRRKTRALGCSATGSRPVSSQWCLGPSSTATASIACRTPPTSASTVSRRNRSSLPSTSRGLPSRLGRPVRRGPSNRPTCCVRWDSHPIARRTRSGSALGWRIRPTRSTASWRCCHGSSRSSAACRIPRRASWRDRRPGSARARCGWGISRAHARAGSSRAHLSDTSFETHAQKLLRLDCEFHRQLSEHLFAEAVHDQVDRVLGRQPTLAAVKDLVLIDFRG